MKLMIAITAPALMALSGCMSDTAMKAPTAVDPLLDKRLVSNSGAVFIIKSDGTMGGELKGQEVKGVYSATATETCSTYTAPPMLVGREYCSVPMIDGDTVVFQRRDGSSSPVYTIEG